MMKKLLAIAAIALSGCTTIHFDNGANPTMGQTTEKWHHNAVLALIEVSDPVNLESECAGQEWSSVQTELTFINGLVSGLVNVIAPVWYPKTVTVNCK